jgi:hypothetical protein
VAGRSTLGWVVVIALNVAAVLAFLWLIWRLHGLATQQPLLFLVVLIPVVTVGAVVLQALTRGRHEEAGSGAATGEDGPQAGAGPDGR